MSEIFSVGVKDFLKGVIVAALSGVITYVYGVVANDTLAIDVHQVYIVAIASGLGYIVKNYLSDESGKFAGLL